MVRIWDAESARETVAPMEGHTGLVFAVGWSPDGSRVVSGGGDDTVRIWDSGKGFVSFVARLGSSVDAVAWTASRLAVGFDRQVVVYDVLDLDDEAD